MFAWSHVRLKEWGTAGKPGPSSAGSEAVEHFEGEEMKCLPSACFTRGFLEEPVGRKGA
jgi:hypothetical protein